MMQTYTLFQYIFGYDVYPSKVLLYLYISQDTTPREISKRMKISRGLLYQTLQFLDDEGYIDRSERGRVKLFTSKVEEKLLAGIAELQEMGKNLNQLRHKAIREKMVELDEEMGGLKELEENLREELQK